MSANGCPSQKIYQGNASDLIHSNKKTVKYLEIHLKSETKPLYIISITEGHKNMAVRTQDL